jgi:serine/threonine-protein kinase RsbT
VCRNIITYAKSGQLTLQRIARGMQLGIEIIAADQGPGIQNVEQAMADGFSTSRSFGMGLPGSKRIMDEFELETASGQGTTITMRKWVRR